MFNETDDVMFSCSRDKIVMMREQLGGRLCDKNMQAVGDRVKSNGVMSVYRWESYVSKSFFQYQFLCSLSGVKMITASPGCILSIAILSAERLTDVLQGLGRNETHMLLCQPSLVLDIHQTSGGVSRIKRRNKKNSNERSMSL